MKKIYRITLSFLFLFSLSFSLFAQNSFFTPKSEAEISMANSVREIKPNKYNTTQADIVQLKTFLWSLPSEKNVGNRNSAPILELPMPDGSMAKFRVWESSIMEAGLEAKFPEMRTFAGQGIDDPFATVRFDYNPYTGFHAQILSSAKGRVYIDPYAKFNVNNYVSYFSKDYTSDVKFICEAIDNDLRNNSSNIVTAACLGTSLRTYRLALACTGEYSVAVASPSPPSVPLSAAAMLVAMNRVNGVYENEVSLRMTLIGNNDLLIYLNGATDPYTNNNGSTMLGENQANIDAVIGTGNYDIGHVFSTGGGGVAVLNSPCNPGTKARGVTGLPNPVGDPFYIDYVAHEMGHQWGGNHSMAGCGSSPASTKYEVGSGTTIQGYAGICGAENIQPNSDPHFHPISFDEISNFISTGGGSTCGTPTATGNTLPVVAALPNNGANIPPSTPFTLSGTATDANNDPLTYSWEQWDTQGTQVWNAGATAAAGNTVPLFKSRLPKTTGVRTFPDIAVILAGYPANPPSAMGGLKGETLSPVARAMNFRLTVRDNRAGGGGVASSGGGGCQTSTPFTINVIAGAPFAVTVPNGGESYPGSSSQTVTWNVSNTNNAPINTANVMISLSTDGGLTYPTVLLASTPNDGTQAVTMPNITTTTARVKVEAIGNVFFDISNANFSITGGTATPPTVTINQAAAQPDPTSASPINFTAIFDQPVIGFTATGVTLSGTAGAVNKVVTGGPSTFNIAVSGMTSSGTVIATIPAGVCTNASAQPNVASTSTDNTVTYNMPAGNDDCSGALPIACGQTLTGTTVGMTIDPVPTCVTPLNTAPGVWYTFVGDGQNTTLSLCTGTAYDSKIGVFSGSCAGLVCVTGNDDFCGLQSQVTFPTVNATTYYVLITGFGTSTGAFTLARTCAPLTIPNDLCTGAIPIACAQTITGTTVGATTDAVGTCVTPLNTAPGVWYTFVGNGVSNTLTLCVGTGYDSKIGVFSGTCAALVCVTGNDDFCGLQSQVTFTPVLGTTYYVLITGFGTATGAFTLTRTCVGPPNDACVGALPIACGQTITGTTVGAQPDVVPFCGTTLTTAPGLWYTFVGNGVSNTLSLCGSLYDTKIGVFSGTCAALVCVTGNDDFCSLQSQVTFTPVLGTTYYVLVTGFSSGAGAFTLNRTCVLPPCLPSTITPAAPSVCQGTIVTLTSSSANTGNPPHIWAPVTDLYTNAAATVPYTGTALNVVYAKPTTTRTYTATLQTTTCIPVPATVTVTVSPNPPLTIVADPGTTICEGDPTRLTVHDLSGPPPAPVPEVLYYKFDGTGTSVPNLASAPPPGSATGTIVGSPTQGGAGQCGTALVGNGAAASTNNMNTGWNTNFTSAFTLSFWLGENQVDNNPSYLFGNSSGASVFRAFYGGAALTNNMLLRGGSADVLITGVNPAATLVTVVYNGTNTTVYKNGVFFQTYAVTFSTSAAAPFLVSGYNSTAGSMTGKLDEFRLYNRALTAGEVGQLTNCSVGVGPQSTGTFLWSPAAGLSSTTSNPVAASPMNTTTYKVVRTTVPGGCKDSATVTITVNKRPTVTTQPVASVNCHGTSATFTVGGTGTGLTYQWQVNTTGCTGGTWTNLTNGAPYSGVTTATLSVNPVTTAMNGYGYRCVLSGTCAPVSGNNISNCVTLTVNPLPVVLATPPSPVCGGVAGINGTALSASGADTYVWTPNGAGSGLYTNTTTSTVYTGTNMATVYAAPTVNTIYTVTGTLNSTGCSNTATVAVVYTPPAPTVVPPSVTMCTTDGAVKLQITSSLAPSPFSTTFNSGPINIPTVSEAPAGINSTINASALPATATLTGVKVKVNLTHTWAGDVAMVLKAPNNQIINLDFYLSGTGAGPTTGMLNTTITSNNTAPALGSGSNPWTGTYRADRVLAGTPAPGPTGYMPTTTNWNALFPSPSGNWTLALWDAFAGDDGVLQDWSITFDYLYGIPASGIWSPTTGLWRDAAMTIPYTGDTANTLWTKPPTVGLTQYSVTVQSLGFDGVQTFANTAPITINNVGPATPYPSNLVVSGLPTANVTVESVSVTGLNHTWANDVDMLLQSPTGQNVILMSDVGGNVPFPTNVNYTFMDGATPMAGAPNASGTYAPTNLVGTLGAEPDPWVAPGPGVVAQPAPALSMFTGNPNGTWKLFIVDDAGGDQGSISGGYNITFKYPTPGCTSAPRIVNVTVNSPAVITTQPISRTICTDKVATFTVVAGGTGPFTYRWEVSTNNGNPPWTTVTNTGVYSGATTATLTITAPPVSMSGYVYRVIVTGAAPCAAATSGTATLTVNPLPVVVITASPVTSLFPGLTTTLSSSVSPNAAASYTWIQNGINVPGGTNATLLVDVDGLGEYQLRVTDVNGCTNLSNKITIKDSAVGRCFLYPNPTSGEFGVRYWSAPNNVLPRTLTIYDSKGQRVHSERYTVSSPYGIMRVDMRAHSKGAYWVELGDLNGNRLAMCKVVVQ